MKAIVFDMDDTLYPEQTYVESGFRAVASWIETEVGLPAGQSFQILWSTHASGQRGHVFDAFLARHPAIKDRIPVPDLVQAYRTHRPNIQLYPGMTALLDAAKAQGFRLGVISDGHLESQTRKVEALGLARWADPILLTDIWGRDFWKPHPRAFQAMEAAFGLRGSDLAYIGDNPNKDFITPNQLGWITIHLEQTGQIHPIPKHLPPNAVAKNQTKYAEGLSRLLWRDNHRL